MSDEYPGEEPGTAAPTWAAVPTVPWGRVPEQRRDEPDPRRGRHAPRKGSEQGGHDARERGYDPRDRDQDHREHERDPRGRGPEPHGRDERPRDDRALADRGRSDRHHDERGREYGDRAYDDRRPRDDRREYDDRGFRDREYDDHRYADRRYEDRPGRDDYRHREDPRAHADGRGYDDRRDPRGYERDPRGRERDPRDFDDRLRDDRRVYDDRRGYDDRGRFDGHTGYEEGYEDRRSFDEYSYGPPDDGPDWPDRSERSERTERRERADRPERSDRSARPERQERPEPGTAYGRPRSRALDEPTDEVPRVRRDAPWHPRNPQGYQQPPARTSGRASVGERGGGVYGSPRNAPVSAAPVSSVPVSSGPLSDAPVSSAPFSDAPVSSGPVGSGPVGERPENSFFGPGQGAGRGPGPEHGPAHVRPEYEDTDPSPARLDYEDARPAHARPDYDDPLSAPLSNVPVSSAPLSAPPPRNAPVSSAPMSGPPLRNAPVSSVPMSGPPVSPAPVSGAPISGGPAGGGMDREPDTGEIGPGAGGTPSRGIKVEFVEVADAPAPPAVASGTAMGAYQSGRVTGAGVDGLQATGYLPIVRPGAEGFPPELAAIAPTSPPGPRAEPAADERGPDPEQVLATFVWRFDPDTLREQIEGDEVTQLNDIRDQLTAKLNGVADNPTRARLLSLRAVVSRILGDLPKAFADGKLALAHAEATGELRRIAIAQARLANVLQWREEFEEADRLYTLANSSELPDRLRATMHQHSGKCSYDQGRYMEACNHFERALDLRKEEDPELIAQTELALDAVFRRVAEKGWGPYPRSREEILKIRRAPSPAFDEQTQRWGYIETDGSFVIGPGYLDVQPFRDGVAWVQRQGAQTWELIDDTGNVLIEPAAGYIGVGSFSDGIAWVSRDGTTGWIAIDKTNTVLIAAGFDDVRPFRRGVAAVRRGHYWGAVDGAGRVVVQFQYDGFATALLDGRYIDGFSDEGLAVVSLDGRKGVVDRSGRVLVPPVHHTIMIHPVAFLFVDDAQRWGALDRRGRTIIQATFASRTGVTDEIDRLLADTRPVM
ncbi:hypothetical protein GCM10020218_013140 [Dactylosporangium vinaceum]|uniref:WG repeat-containing protein n=1 Tax=Dactylosporangium vinaceum TaxID=53362 RepID=A0ABV5MNI4_9ACTN|nr:WG repeat-containing protein [Dactylosporangium vinaceum]